jgi:hypothetical protein
MHALVNDSLPWLAVPATKWSACFLKRAPQLCQRICGDLGVLEMDQIFGTRPPVADDLAGLALALERRSATPLVAL